MIPENYISSHITIAKKRFYNECPRFFSNMILEKKRSLYGNKKIFKMTS